MSWWISGCMYLCVVVLKKKYVYVRYLCSEREYNEMTCGVVSQAHETAIRAMRWSHSDSWMVTADHAGYIKYWQSNMNNVKMYQAHKEPVRGIRWEGKPYTRLGKPLLQALGILHGLILSCLNMEIIVSL